MSLRPRTTYNNTYGHTLVTRAASEPVSVSELRDTLKLEIGNEEILLQNLIIEATEEIEKRYNLAMLTQSWKLTLDNWPGSALDWWDGVRDGAVTEAYGDHAARWVTLPRYPLQSITSVKTYNSAGTPTTLTVSDYFDVDISSKRGRMILKDGQVWPTAERSNNAVEITYVAGYGDSPFDVPAPLRRAVRQMAAYLYQHRGDCDAGQAIKESGITSTLGMYGVTRI